MSRLVHRAIVSTAKAPKAIGPYNQAVVANDTIYISGQIGFDLATMEVVGGGVEAEAQQALKHMGAILEAAGCGYEHVVKTTVLLKDINDFAKVNNIYSDFFSKSKPARAAYQVAALPRGASVEIEAIAVRGQIVELN